MTHTTSTPPPKSIPMAFSTTMVEAISLGRKTQTRRICALQPDSESCYIPRFINNVLTIDYNQADQNPTLQCPAKIGDILWVREEHKITWLAETNQWQVVYRDGYTQIFHYKQLPLTLNQRLHARKTLGQWQRARFLPKAFARIFLEITNIKVEQLWQISEQDAIAEGIHCQKLNNTAWYNDYMANEYSTLFPCVSYRSLWQKINGAESWDENPIVWVYEFEQIERPVEF